MSLHGKTKSFKYRGFIFETNFQYESRHQVGPFDEKNLR